MASADQPTRATATQPAPAQFFIEQVTLRNFKGIEHLKVEFEPDLTLLVGRNNAGKSRILRALEVAVGGARAERDDLTIGSNEPARIDVIAAPLLPLTAPTGLEGRGAEDGNQVTGELFDTQLQALFAPVSFLSGSATRQRFGFRTTIDRASEGTGARSHSRTLSYDLGEERWEYNERTFVSNDVRLLLHADLIDTQRDIDQELRQRGTAVRRLLNELRIDDSERNDLEQKLTTLGEDLLEHSATLIGLRDSLDGLDRFLDSVGSARVDPVPRTLEELARVVGVSFDEGPYQLPSRLQGSGVRSLASLLVQDVFYREILGRDGGNLRPHSLTLVEEPEAHLHPHATWEVANLLGNGTTQIVATTHSALLATSVKPEALRLVRHSPAQGHRVIPYGPAPVGAVEQPRTRQSQHYRAEMEKFKRLLDETGGDLLFASAVVIGDGATERAFLPSILRDCLGSLAHGVSVIDSRGMNDNVVIPVIKFCDHAEVPFVIFADADQAGDTRVQGLIDNGQIKDIEDVIRVTSSDRETSNGGRISRVAIEHMMISFDIDVCRSACREFGEEPEGEQQTLDAMSKLKGSIGAVLAREFLDAYPYSEHAEWPEALLNLRARLVQKLAAPAGGSEETA